MKPITESPETMSAYAQIDLGYYLIEDIQFRIQSFGHKASPIEKMVDEQTGYGKFRVREFRKAAIDAIEMVIAAKKVIEADYSKDEAFLDELLKQVSK